MRPELEGVHEAVQLMSESYVTKRIEKSGCKAIATSNFDESLVTAFERVALTFPTRIALGSDPWQPTFQELNETANRLAHRLIACGVGLGDRTAIMMAHDAQMVAAVCGALKAGQIMVPLGPDDPLARLKMMVEDTEPSVIVTDAQNRELAAQLAPRDCRILDFESETTTGPVDNPSIEIPPGQTAFLVYTSGTTGRPKGVMKTHRQTLRDAAVHAEALQCTENDRISHFSVLSTGQGAAGIWRTLLSGARLCLFPIKTRGVTGLAEWIIDRGLTVYVSSASIFRTLMRTLDDQQVFSNVRAVRLASEAVTADDVAAFRTHFPRRSLLVHTLASSETSTIAWSRWAPDDVIPDGVLPVGHFASDIDVSLLGDDGQLVAPGEVGDIEVKSRYVANGYWRDPELTADKFSDDLDGRGTRLVRTGDLGRINADGLLEFHGRKDHRIKIRGNQIDLTDVERALNSLPGIERAAAVAVRRETHEPLLVAFVVKASDASWTAPRLRHAVRANLPLYMVPSRIVLLDSLPYNRGNKIDREALCQAFPARDDVRGEEPRTETEVLLANIWAETLELTDIGRDDDFFDLGGDSLKGAIVAAQAHDALGVDLSLGEIADHPTVSALAAFIDGRRRAGAAGMPAIAAAPRAASMPLSFQQEAMWQDCRGAQCTDVHSSRVIGPLDIDIYQECLRTLVERHEILRTTFGLVDGRPAQIIHPSGALGFSFMDLSDADDPEAQADTIFREAAARPIDLVALPIVRHVLVKIANNSHRLACIHSFMTLDGFASGILEAELASLYEARWRGREPPLPRDAPLQYADYAVWQRNVSQVDGPYIKDAINWWQTLLSTAPSPTRLPFQRLIRRTSIDPSEGVLRWMPEESVGQRLEDIARSAGTTNFIVRLAVFAALIADLGGNATVVIGTFFDNRHRTEAQAIVGRLVNWVPLVLSYDPDRTFRQWLETVHHRVFETLANSELPFDKILERLHAVGTRPTGTQITFMLSRDRSDQRFGSLTISDESRSIGTMPAGCLFYVDAKRPDNCQVRFDARLYEPEDMRALVDRYLRLLDATARAPELPIGQLQTMIGGKPPRLTRKFAAMFYRLVEPYYTSSPLLQMIWRRLRQVLVKCSS
jgi:amino acid adenylation domain-containing protein